MEIHKLFLVYLIASRQWLGRRLSVQRVISRIRFAGGNKHERTEHVLSAIIKLHYMNFRELLIKLLRLTARVTGPVGARIGILL